MVGWQWHRLDLIQIICTSLQTDNHASTSSLNFLQTSCYSGSLTGGRGGTSWIENSLCVYS